MIFCMVVVGFIYLIRNGGSDHQIAPSKRVNIHTKKGLVKAIFGWPAIHTRKTSTEKAPKLDNIFLDCGCNSKKEVEKLGVHVGCVVTYEDKFMILNKKFYIGRALDNRIGGFMIAEVARLLKETKITLPYGLYITNSVQEEVGLRGAQMISESINPDVAIITDSGADFNEESLDIHVVPVRYSFGDKGYIDKVSQTTTEFFEELAYLNPLQ